ncbi:MAG: ORF6N domain-containing protein [Neisseriaceae bacterium]|jgi:hypothetical protein
MQIIEYSNIKIKIVEIRSQQVILHSDVTKIYDLSTKEINQAASRNLNKFPESYFIKNNNQEKDELVEDFNHLVSAK